MTVGKPHALRILFIAPFAPTLDGPHGGSQAVARLILGISERHRVALVHFQVAGEPPVDDQIASRCELVESVSLVFGDSILAWSRRQCRVALGLLRAKPRWVSNWSSTSFRRQLREIVRDWEPDIVQAEFHVMGQYLGEIQESPAGRVLVQHEPGVRGAAKTDGIHSGIRGLLASVEMRAWRRYEAGIMRSADAVVAFTEQDRAALHGVAPDAHIEVIPLGVPLPPLATVESSGPPRLLFVGNFVHPPNVDAALHLISAIFPGVRDAVPECRLEIVGAGPPESIRAHAGDNITVTGQVASVAPYMNHASVVVVPLRLGGGMRVKMMDALAAGKAVVASPLAAEGLEVTDGEQLRIARSDAEFVSTVIELLRAPQRRAALGASAREWAAQHLNPSVMVSRYEHLYHRL